MRTFIDINTGRTWTESELKAFFDSVVLTSGDIYNNDQFAQWLSDATGKNGMLREERA